LFAATINETEIPRAAQGVFNTPSNAEKHRVTAIGTLQRGR
jgi:hypothetical protein